MCSPPSVFNPSPPRPSIHFWEAQWWWCSCLLKFRNRTLVSVLKLLLLFLCKFTTMHRLVLIGNPLSHHQEICLKTVWPSVSILHCNSSPWATHTLRGLIGCPPAYALQKVRSFFSRFGTTMCSGHSLALSIPFVAMLGRDVLITARSCDVQALIGTSCACRWSSTLKSSNGKKFDGTSEASCACAVSVPTTPTWWVLVLLLESATRRRRWKSKHVAETLLREFLSNACSPSCFDNLLRLEAPAHGDALGHDAVVDDGTRSSRHDIERFCGAFCAAGPRYGCRSTALLHERGDSRVAAQLGRDLERRHRCQRDWQAGPRKLRSFEKCWLCRQSR